MFYSHTFLGRKGPLGTVWFAAHLNKLKKSHYTSTNVPSTVELIMLPDVPIALRTSAHLLLGVVRIYSKQVDYFFQDCRILETGIRNAFLFTNVNLPEDATHAPYHSITLPETFELDALTLEEDLDLNGFKDTHLKTPEEITLQDETHEDQYIAIFINEETGKSLSKSGGVSELAPTPMEIDSDPSNPNGTSVQSENANQAGSNGGTVPQDLPEIEIMRDAVHDHSFENVLLWSNQGNDVMEPDTILEEQIMKDKETASPSPVVEETLASGGHALPSQQRQETPSAPSAEAHEFANPEISFGYQSPDLVLRSTPVVEPNRRRGNRRLLRIDDDAIVFQNNEMKARLKDTSKIKRKKKGAPLSSLDIWKINKRRKKDGMFFEPLITGLCDDLCNVYKEDFVSAKVKMVSSQEDHEGPSDNRSPPSGNDLDMEIERLRDNQYPAYTNLLSEILPSPTNFTSSIRKDDFTPATTAIGTESDVGRTTESGVLPTPDLASSSGHVGFDMETPSTWYEEEHGVENTVLSDIPEFDDSAGDLSFLEQDVNSPIGIRGTPEVGYSSSKQGETPGFDTLHARTRAVAQYLKEKSPRTPISEESGDLSLNTILEGKTRKICSRMFFETLVLKNCGLVDAKQNEPYGDIALKVTSKLNEQF